jgi:general secretion pathway protein G
MLELIRNKNKNKKQKGFTLLELLIVIATIGLLASIVSGSSYRARVLARHAKAQKDLVNINTAVQLLVSDTGKWPFGCPVGTTAAGAEGHLNLPLAGLVANPGVNTFTVLCDWYPGDVVRWNGPYITANLKDPWGLAYYFEANRYVPGVGAVPSIFSFGEDRTAHTADDIILMLK